MIKLDFCKNLCLHECLNIGNWLVVKNKSKLEFFDKRNNKSKLLINKESGQQVKNIYLCGPTVYDHVHIGNLRPVIVFDVLHRLLLNLNFKVNYVQNITDIDDKIIEKARQRRKAEMQISRYYTEAYFSNLINYNIIFPKYFPRVSENIHIIQKFIQVLIEKKSAYEYNGEVIFRVTGNENYGKLSGQRLSQLRKSSSKIINSNKLDTKDFICWKKTTAGLKWDSSWGMGRPGWHSECVAFIQKFFSGQTIDIHGGGNDLLFPHHENERIQYLAHNDKELSKSWLHVAHLQWKGEKMSKSLGNVILAKDFYRQYGTNVFRYLILSSHHSQVINFSEQLIQQALEYIKKITNLRKRLNFFLYLEKKIIAISKKKSKLQKEVIEHLSNNLNTVKVIHLLNEIISLLNKSIDIEEDNYDFEEKINDFNFILDILGFKFDLQDYGVSTRLLIKKWQKFQEDKNYHLADQIRKKLQNKGIL